MNTTGVVVGRLKGYQIREILLKSNLDEKFKRILFNWYDEAVKIGEVDSLGLVISRPVKYDLYHSSNQRVKEDA